VSGFRTKFAALRAEDPLARPHSGSAADDIEYSDDEDGSPSLLPARAEPSRSVSPAQQRRVRYAEPAADTRDGHSRAARTLAVPSGDQPGRATSPLTGTASDGIRQRSPYDVVLRQVSRRTSAVRTVSPVRSVSPAPAPAPAAARPTPVRAATARAAGPSRPVSQRSSSVRPASQRAMSPSVPDVPPPRSTRTVAVAPDMHDDAAASRPASVRRSTSVQPSRPGTRASVASTPQRARPHAHQSTPPIELRGTVPMQFRPILIRRGGGLGVPEHGARHDAAEPVQRERHSLAYIAREAAPRAKRTPTQRTLPRVLVEMKRSCGWVFSQCSNARSKCVAVCGSTTATCAARTECGTSTTDTAAPLRGVTCRSMPANTSCHVASILPKFAD
jgi:hypothetical protein